MAQTRQKGGGVP